MLTFPLNRRGGIVGLLTWLLVVPGHAQTCLPLQGRWTMNTAQSRLAAGLSFNPYFRVDEVGLTLSYEAGGLMTQKWHFSGPHIHDGVTYAFTIDGRLQPTHAHSVLDSVPLDVVPSWQNCTLIVDARSSLFGTDIWTHNIYVLDAAGERLSILQTAKSAIGRAERTLVFARTGDAP